MEGNIYITGLIGSLPNEKGIELVDIISQVKKQPEATSFTVHINSEGGVVDTGFDIYNYLKSLSVPIKTIGSGLVASIATVVFMAGDQRTLREGTRFMIHLPMGGIDGTADEIEEYSKHVRQAEDQVLKFYSETMALDKNVIKTLLREDTWLDAEKTTDLGFTTQQSLPMVARAYFNLNTDKMTQLSNDDKSWIEKQFEKITNAFKPQVTAVMVQDANGVSIDFPEVEEGQEIVVGAKATVEGANAEGEYVMPTGETYVFAGGELTEIKEAEAADEDMQALKDENASLKEQLEAQTTANATLNTELETQKEAVVNLENEVKEFKSQITSRFDLDEKSEKKEEKKEVKKRTLLKQE